jgi:hypothetical protein
MAKGFNPDILEYEVIEGSLEPGQGGAMGEYLRTWPKLCYFGLLVPPGAVEFPIDFTMRIPTREMYDTYPEIEDEIIIRLGPSGTEFLEPITVHATWMPWAGDPPPELEFTDGVTSGRADPIYLPDIRRWSVTFQIDHFSDWRVRPAPKGE